MFVHSKHQIGVIHLGICEDSIILKCLCKHLDIIANSPLNIINNYSYIVYSFILYSSAIVAVIISPLYNIIFLYISPAT